MKKIVSDEAVGELATVLSQSYRFICVSVILILKNLLIFYVIF